MKVSCNKQKKACKCKNLFAPRQLLFFIYVYLHIQPEALFFLLSLVETKKIDPTVIFSEFCKISATEGTLDCFLICFRNDSSSQTCSIRNCNKRFGSSSYSFLSNISLNPSELRVDRVLPLVNALAGTKKNFHIPPSIANSCLSSKTSMSDIRDIHDVTLALFRPPPCAITFVFSLYVISEALLNMSSSLACRPDPGRHRLYL
ncbi:unnamed protein product [Albugo candida]|uniref:Uncharacterized protein n=1 Tax=Albugo candida TaxID=65357 RepID=A0A024GVC4_9STRA|nr:unnamed protein product [Albugo candida]|eukprot:CCI50778.1 unnamed protein product [Albugo candida]